MKILLVNQTFYPDVAATAQYLTDLGTDLVKQGHEVSVLCTRRGYYAPHPLYSKEEEYQGIKIIRVWPFHLGRKIKALRVIDGLLVNFALMLKLLFMPRFDQVIALTSPPLLAWCALLATKWKRTKFVYWVMDINPDQAIQAGWLKPSSLMAKVLKQALRFILKYSDKIVVLDEFMKENIINKGANPDQIAVIPLWGQAKELFPIAHANNPFRKEHNLEDKFVVMYSGNHSLCHPLDTLLEGALKLQQDSSIVFMFIGAGEGVKRVQAFREEHNLENIIHLPYQAREKLKYSLSAADLHIISMGEPFVGIVHPSKIYGALNVGRPFVFIGPKQSHIGKMIDTEAIGQQVDHGESEKIASIIADTAIAKTSEAEGVINQIRDVGQKYSRTRLSTQFISVLEDNQTRI